MQHSSSFNILEIFFLDPHVRDSLKHHIYNLLSIRVRNSSTVLMKLAPNELKERTHDNTNKDQKFSN